MRGTPFTDLLEENGLLDRSQGNTLTGEEQRLLDALLDAEEPEVVAPHNLPALLQRIAAAKRTTVEAIMERFPGSKLVTLAKDPEPYLAQRRAWERRQAVAAMMEQHFPDGPLSAPLYTSKVKP